MLSACSLLICCIISRYRGKDHLDKVSVTYRKLTCHWMFHFHLTPHWLFCNALSMLTSNWLYHFYGLGRLGQGVCILLQAHFSLVVSLLSHFSLALYLFPLSSHWLYHFDRYWGEDDLDRVSVTSRKLTSHWLYIISLSLLIGCIVSIGTGARTTWTGCL